MESKIDNYIRSRLKSGKGMFALCGGRRSGKTWGILTFLLLSASIRKESVNVASMTNNQGRLGAYSDCQSIVSLHPVTFSGLTFLSSPREIRFDNGSRIFFNSYQNSETAKGVACDWLFVNEANNFTKQQVVDLMANVRKGVFFDFNPNVKFWIGDYFSNEEICNTTWQDNPHLTPLQLEYFKKLRELGERENASSVDRYNYLVYYKGEYSEMSGDIFSAGNITIADAPDDGVTLGNYCVFADPSALRGADWFAMVLSAKGSDGKVYIVDTFSRNEGTREVMARKMLEWCRTYDVNERCYVETNGIIGIDFFDFAQNSGIPIHPWYSHRNKFERIVANYEGLTNETIFLRNAELAVFLEQCYEFSQKCEHDDNIDAVNSSYNLQKFLC